MPKTHARYCTNSRCNLFEVPMEFGKKQKLCNNCGHKTEYLGAVVTIDPDMPPSNYDPSKPNTALTLIEGEPLPVKDNEPLTFTCSDIKNCPIAPNGALVRVPFSLYQKWLWLAHQFSVEWIAFLTGSKNDAGEWVLDADGMYFPNQIATGATVQAESLSSKKERTIGSVHSHVDMSANFSTTDYEHFNNDVEIVINRHGLTACVTRSQLKCGEYQRTRSKIIYTEAQDLNKCVADLKSKLVIDTYVVKAEQALTEPKKGPGPLYLPAHYSKQSPRPDDDRLCTHKRKLTDYCHDCKVSADAAHDSTSVNMTEINTINPTDSAVRMALKIIQRRVNHDPSSLASIMKESSSSSSA